MPNRNHADLSDALTRSLKSGKAESICAALKAIEAEGTNAHVAEVAPLVREQKLAEPVLSCLDALLGRARALDFISIDEGQRRWSGPTISHWSKKEATRLLLGKGVFLRRRAQSVSPTLAALAACHSNGYVRQAALEMLADREPNRVGLAISIIRCNDWVRPVREIARRIVEANLTEERAAEFVELLPLVLHLRTCGRDSHESLIDAACRLLRAGDGAPFLRQAVESADPRVRWSALEVAKQLGTDEAEAFFLVQLDHGLPTVRAAAFRELCSRLHQDALVKLARTRLSDHSGQVRREALLVLCQHPPEDFESLLDGILFDRNRTVRWVAVDQLKRRFGKDPVQRIRDELSTEGSSHLEGCLDALGEHGNRDDVPKLSRFLDSESPRNRAAAIRAISRLDSSGTLERIADAIFDDSPRVAKAARESVNRGSVPLIRHRLEKAMDSKMLPHVRRGALLLLLRLPALDALEYALAHIGDPDDRVENIARSQLGISQDRFVRFYDKPSEKQVRRVLELLEAVPDAELRKPWQVSSVKDWLRNFLKTLLPH